MDKQKQHSRPLVKPNREPFAKVDFKVDGDKVIVGKRTYGINQLFILSGVIRFLSLVLITMGLMRFMVSGWIGLLYVAMGIATYGLGYVYKRVSRAAKAQTEGKS